MDERLICAMNWIKVRNNCTICRPHSLTWVQLIPVARRVKSTGDGVWFSGWPGFSKCLALFITLHRALLAIVAMPAEPLMVFPRILPNPCFKCKTAKSQFTDSCNRSGILVLFNRPGKAVSQWVGLCRKLTATWSHRWEMGVRFGPIVVIYPENGMEVHPPEVLPVSNIPPPPLIFVYRRYKAKDRHENPCNIAWTIRIKVGNE